MLSRKNRIPRKDFGEISISKVGSSTESFVLRHLGGPLEPRVAVSVSKKVSKSAVDRNRIRRRVYSALLREIKNLKPSFYLIVAKPNANKLSSDNLNKEILELLNQLKRR